MRHNGEDNRRRSRATVRVLGEGVVATVDVPEGATAGDLIRAAGSEPRSHGWDLFLDGRPVGLDAPMNQTPNPNLAYVPRTRGG